METKNHTNRARTRKLVVNVSEDAYQCLQREAVRIDRHAANFASDVVELALLALDYNSDGSTEQGGKR